MLSDDQLCSDSEQDRESATHQLYFLENPKIKEDHLEQSDDCSVTCENNNMILLVKECEEADSRILRSLASSDSYELQHDQVESSDDQFNEVTSASATVQASSKIKMKISLGEGVEDNNDGFQTPTKFHDNELSSNSLNCPPAPRKPKAKPLGKRKRVYRNLQIEFVYEIESAFRFLISGDHPNVKRARSRGG